VVGRVVWQTHLAQRRPSGQQNIYYKKIFFAFHAFQIIEPLTHVQGNSFNDSEIFKIHNFF
jgi:hypothetical protein